MLSMRPLSHREIGRSEARLAALQPLARGAERTPNSVFSVIAGSDASAVCKVPECGAERRCAAAGMFREARGKESVP